MTDDMKIAVSKFFKSLDYYAKKYIDAIYNNVDFELTRRAADSLYSKAWQLACDEYRPSAFVMRVLNSYDESNDPATLMEFVEERASELESADHNQYKKAGAGWFFVLSTDDAKGENAMKTIKSAQDDAKTAAEKVNRAAAAVLNERKEAEKCVGFAFNTDDIEERDFWTARVHKLIERAATNLKDASAAASAAVDALYRASCARDDAPELAQVAEIYKDIADAVRLVKDAAADAADDYTAARRAAAVCVKQLKLTFEVAVDLATVDAVAIDALASAEAADRAADAGDVETVDCCYSKAWGAVATIAAISRRVPNFTTEAASVVADHAEKAARAAVVRAAANAAGQLPPPPDCITVYPHALAVESTAAVVDVLPLPAPVETAPLV